ncbi:TIGR02996 domain-containing protein [Limnoglobus roseus]|uniref:TIGR02996 domain-containing protein n=1 Tax=Limnoglobus roseus TaxID=2598579 RepID=A0A5C1AGP8_9BACT|nr:TIGR02996 domain-containing protein [Limnoglobus roseus]QEL17156.1 TIGR02996 domain-containing protein [Limnoglobus roseus]
MYATEDEYQAHLDRAPADWAARVALGEFLKKAKDPRAAGYRALGRCRKYPHRSTRWVDYPWAIFPAGPLCIEREETASLAMPWFQAACRRGEGLEEVFVGGLSARGAEAMAGKTRRALEDLFAYAFRDFFRDEQRALIANKGKWLASAPSQEMPERERGFQKRLDARPDDHVARLVFADWLEERDDERAEGYRVLGLLRKWPEKSVSVGGEKRHYFHATPRPEDWQAHDDLPRAWLEEIWVYCGGSPSMVESGGGRPDEVSRRLRREVEDFAAIAFGTLPSRERERIRSEALAAAV